MKHAARWTLCALLMAPTIAFSHDGEDHEKNRPEKGERQQKRAEMHGEMMACRADKEKFCGDVEPGEGRIIQCMKAHESELSGGCRQMMAHQGKQGKNGGMGMEACKGDIESLCPGVKPGDGRLVECLKANFDKLSPQCKAMKEKHMKHRQAKEMKHEKHDE
jgi:hypothetical protein